MYNNVRSQTSFSRTLDNTAKMGAYYTDVSHCIDLGKKLRFPEGKEVSVLEPSIGDGEAVIALTGARANENIKIFGVELNEKSAKETKAKPEITECLEADFLEGVRIKNSVFSLCFGNPPYMEDDLNEDGKDRVERQFLEKVTNYLSKDGILVWVIPYRSFTEFSSMRFMMCHYDILAVYKFRESEYQKYHQVGIIARKVDGRSVIKPEVDENILRYELDNIPTLDSDAGEGFEVMPSSSEKVTLFCSKVFDTNEAFMRLTDWGSDEFFDDLNKIVNRNLTQEVYKVGDIGKPPIPLKKDSLYLLCTSGCGQGKSGSEEKNDIHLQRGIAEVIEESDIREDETGNATETVTSRTKVTMTIVEQSGRITELS